MRVSGQKRSRAQVLSQDEQDWEEEEGGSGQRGGRGLSLSGPESAESRVFMKNLKILTTKAKM